MKSSTGRFTVLLSIFCGFLLLGGLQSVSGQLFVGLGGQVGYMNMDAANRPVDFFNGKGFLIRNQRQWHWPAGLIYAASYREDGLLLELSLNTKRHRTGAEFAGAGNTISRREHRFVMQSLNAAIGGAVVEKDDFLLYLCGGIDLGIMRYRTRTANKENINRANFNTVNQKRFIGTTLSVRFTFREDKDDYTLWTLAPYVQLPLSKFDFNRFNQVLNPFDSQTVGGDLQGRPVNFGFNLQFDFDLIEFLQ